MLQQVALPLLRADHLAESDDPAGGVPVEGHHLLSGGLTVLAADPDHRLLGAVAVHVPVAQRDEERLAEIVRRRGEQPHRTLRGTLFPPGRQVHLRGEQLGLAEPAVRRGR